jgi:hypothetical protein
MHMTLPAVFNKGGNDEALLPGHMSSNELVMQLLNGLDVAASFFMYEMLDLLHVALIPAPIFPAQSPSMNPSYFAHGRQAVVVVTVVVAVAAFVTVVVVVAVVVVPV